MTTCTMCEKPTATNSKYCTEHKIVARNRFFEMLNEQKELKSQRAEDFNKWYTEAHEAGMKAAKECAVIPMVVQQHSNMMDDTSPVEQQWVCNDGVCGFAWINVRPANCSFANWLKKNNLGKTSHYEGGCIINVSMFNQSLTRKEAYAHAFSNVLNSYGIKAYSNSRID